MTVTGSAYLTGLGQGWLHTAGGTNALTSSTSPTVAYLTATSTTATSTFAGGVNLTATGNGLNFGSNTLFYQNNERFLTSSTTAAGNLTIGYQSATGLDANGGLNNTGVGYQAMGNATSTSYNTALGYQALKGSATISNVGSNTAVGYKALFNNSSGLNNTANGYQALRANTTGSNNVANGWASLDANTTGSNNVASGMYSLIVNTAGNNTAYGHASFISNTTGTGNVGLGYYSGRGDGTTADQRSVIDNYMTFLGYQASRDSAIASTTALTNGTAIGKNARVAQSNAIVLGGTGSDAVNVGIGTTSPWAKLSIQNTYGSLLPLFDIASSTSAAYATSSIFRINADGNIGIGTTSPWRTLSVTGSMAVTALTAGAAGDFAVCINNTTKELTNAGDTGCVVSSKRFKENISEL
ncbi:MAG: hypothetical protein HW401_79, partial [Parcubacteria group bacterium]|nr:hypothetical protein [Parcubacteria group bacterium]